MDKNKINKINKIKNVIEYGCLDVLIFMIGLGIIDKLYSDNKILLIGGSIAAIFGTTPITSLIYNRSKKD